MSVIPVERCLGGVELGEPRLSPDGSMLAYIRSAGAASAIMLTMFDPSNEQVGPAQQLSTYPPPRPGRGLGGGCLAWTPDSKAVVYAATDGNVWLQHVPGGALRRLTEFEGRTAQAPCVSSTGDAVVVVDQSEIWLVPVEGPARRLDDGSADFCFDPSISASGEVVWHAWNVPNMAWDASRLEAFDLRTGTRKTIFGTGSVQQPRHATDGSLLCVRDDTGWTNVWRDDRVLVDEPFEHAGPTWGLGQRSFACSPDGARLAFTRNEHGFGRLCVVDIATGTVADVARGVHGQLSWHGDRLAALRTGARTPPQIVVHDTASWARTVVDIGSVSGWDRAALVEPELVELPSRDGAVLHARLFRAPAARDGSAAPMICWLHGGPTDQWQVTFMPRLAYWRSQGFNILVPDHRGSTGHGREYQQAMNGRWGDLDVSDTIDAIEHAHRSGWSEPGRTVLIGGSAGGFTVLGVVAAAPDIAAGAVVAYPVADLFDVAQRGDRFERHSTHHLVGPIPASTPDRGPYVERSPIAFADRITTPLLMFHGDVDPVVPVEQSEGLADRIRAAGGTVELVVYAGEGHGFRAPQNQLDEYRRTQAFLLANGVLPVAGPPH